MMLTPYRVIFIVLAVGLSLNLWMVLSNNPQQGSGKPVFGSAEPSPPTTLIDHISPQSEQQKPITAEQVTRETIAARAYNGALQYCNTKPLNGLAPEACTKFVEQFKSRCMAKVVPTMPLYFDEVNRAIPYADKIIYCLLPPIALPNSARQ